jgi:NAD+ kinase
MKIALHGLQLKTEALPYLVEMLNYLEAKNTSLTIHKPYSDQLKSQGINLPAHQTYIHRNELSSELDCVFSLGGDGTLLDALTFIGEKQIPILGINTGRLGFLATIPRDAIITALDHLHQDKVTYEERTLIQLDSDKNLFDDLNFALNEFSIIKRDSASMIVIHTYLDDEYLNSYWADGLLISTPTGSTGYSLSCGGPLVAPQSNIFIITPVNPHNLNVRPMVVPDTGVLSFKIEGRSQNYLAVLDSRSETVNQEVRLTVRKAAFNARLISLPDHHFFKTLRSKLNWGLDMRN